MNFKPENGFMLADGERMAIGFPAREFGGEKSVYLISNYRPASFSVYQPTVDIDTYGGLSRQLPSGPQETTIEIKAYGPFTMASPEETMKLFRSASSMSVNELLAEAFKKMDER